MSEQIIQKDVIVYNLNSKNFALVLKINETTDKVQVQPFDKDNTVWWSLHSCKPITRSILDNLLSKNIIDKVEYNRQIDINFYEVEQDSTNTEKVTETINEIKGEEINMAKNTKIMNGTDDEETNMDMNNRSDNYNPNYHGNNYKPNFHKTYNNNGNSNYRNNNNYHNNYHNNGGNYENKPQKVFNLTVAFASSDTEPQKITNVTGVRFNMEGYVSYYTQDRKLHMISTGSSIV